jgi:hypothetical protein
LVKAVTFDGVRVRGRVSATPVRIRSGAAATAHACERVERDRCALAPGSSAPPVAAAVADLSRSTLWAGLRPGDPVQVDGTRLRGASWHFVAHVTNRETGETWVEVVGGRAGDRSVRSFRPDQLYAPSARPGHDLSLADAPGLPLA